MICQNHGNRLCASRKFSRPPPSPVVAWGSFLAPVTRQSTQLVSFPHLLSVVMDPFVFQAAKPSHRTEFPQQGQSPWEEYAHGISTCRKGERLFGRWTGDHGWKCSAFDLIRMPSRGTHWKTEFRQVLLLNHPTWIWNAHGCMQFPEQVSTEVVVAASSFAREIDHLTFVRCQMTRPVRLTPHCIRGATNVPDSKSWGQMEHSICPWKDVSRRRKLGTHGACPCINSGFWMDLAR